MKSFPDKKNDKKQKKSEQAVDAFVRGSSQKRDPLGSYTGKPNQPNEVPTQDCDDL